MRHLAFWVGIVIVSAILSIGDPLTGFYGERIVFRAILCTVCLLPFCIIFSYCLLYFLFPVYLKKKKYFAFITGIILLFSFGLWLDFHTTSLFFTISGAHHLTSGQIIVASYSFVWYAAGAGAMALGLRFFKKMYLQKKENLILARQKTSMEMKLLKAHIQPDFLLGTLENIHREIEAGSQTSPVMIMKFSELLSYLLYESDHELVSFEKEITAVNDFIIISRLSGAKNKIDLKISGEIENKFIAPKLLLTNIQNIFSEVEGYKEDLDWVAIHISVANDKLMLEVLLQFAEGNDVNFDRLESFKKSTQRNLSIFYPMNCCVFDLRRQQNQLQMTLILTLSQENNFPERPNKEIMKTNQYDPA
ncbi:MAG: histidine kinase [Bacteroidetes bacterium]|nr:histidine kinase [Bacteroidota bacterium]MBS1633605.1 histidine kinase [Bacteroidota bacterium]